MFFYCVNIRTYVCTYGISCSEMLLFVWIKVIRTYIISIIILIMCTCMPTFCTHRATVYMAMCGKDSSPVYAYVYVISPLGPGRVVVVERWPVYAG